MRSQAESEPGEQHTQTLKSAPASTDAAALVSREASLRLH